MAIYSYIHTVQLKGNLMPACGSPGEKVQVNLQMGVGKGACNILHQPNHGGGHPFRYKFLKFTVVRVTDAALFIHSSLCESSRVIID